MSTYSGSGRSGQPDSRFPEAKAAWRRLVRAWRLLRAERMLSKAGDLFNAEGEPALALECYDLSLQSATRLDEVKK